MSVDEKVVSKLFWRGWVVNERMERAARAGMTQERRELAGHLDCIETEFEGYLRQIARSDREQLRLW